MLGTLKGRILVIATVLLAGGWYLIDNGITLGLDLQGGTHLVLEIEDEEGTLTPEARAEAADRALKIIRTRVDQFGVSEPIIQKSGEDRIIVELAGIQDVDRAKDIIEQSAYLEFQLVRTDRAFADALPRIDRAIVQALGPEGLPDRPAADTVAEDTDAAGERVEDLLFGGEEPEDGEVPEGTQDAEAPDTAPTDAEVDESAEADTGELAADDEVEDQAEQEAAELAAERPLTSLLFESASAGEFMVAESDVPLVERYLELPEVQRVIPRDIQLRWHYENVAQGAELYRSLFVLDSDVIMTGEALEDATAGRDPQTNETIVPFELNRAGGRQLDRFTQEHIGDRMAIVLDQQVFSAPEIMARIANRGQIQMGQSPLAEAQDLALVLRAGALPAPVNIIEERTVGPSLGADSIAQGRMAGIVGIILVILAMALYYRAAGLIAIGALVVYVVLVMGMLAALGASLTLPGIAGLILSVGMAVDANVLIFERVREELDGGRIPRIAVDEGFQHAMSAIVDANLTTLLTALILFQIGTGPVRGFAVTLSIGIIASFFSAVYVTRSFFLLYMARKRGTDPISI